MAAARIAFRSVKRQRRLTPDQKKARRNYCREGLRKGMKRLQATVFVDESNFDLQPTGRAKAAVMKGGEPQPYTDATAKKRSAIKIHYISAVMHGIGNVAFHLTSGTTWLPSRYKSKRTGGAASTMTQAEFATCMGKIKKAAVSKIIKEVRQKHRERYHQQHVLRMGQRGYPQVPGPSSHQGGNYQRSKAANSAPLLRSPTTN
eukprot:jgi/Botrbrau1/20084/Bobra.200_1s0087.1